MCGVAAAFVGFVLDTTFVELCIGASHFLGSYADVLRNWLRLMAAAAGLERRTFLRRFANRSMWN